MTSPEKAIYFLERSMQNLSKTVKKEMFPTEFSEFFLFFSQFVTHFFSQKNQRDATFFTFKQNHLISGVKVLIQYLTYGNNVNIHFLMWCDVQSEGSRDLATMGC